MTLFARIAVEPPGLADVAMETLVYLSVFLALIFGNKYLPHLFPGALPFLRLRWDTAQQKKEALVPKKARKKSKWSHEPSRRRQEALQVVTESAPAEVREKLTCCLGSSEPLGPTDAAWLLRSVERSCPQRTPMVLQVIHETGAELGPSAYAAAICSALSDHQAVRAKELLAAVREQHGGTVVFYTALVQQCARNGRPRLAVAAYEDMVASGIAADALCYNAVIHACAETGLVDEATRILNAMRTVGNLRPTLVTYNSLIHCCAKNGLGSKALEILREMEEVGVEADLITYNTVCSALAKTGRVDQAAGMLEEMRQRNVAPDVITYNSVLSACAHADDWHRGLELLGTMRAGSTKPDVISYNTVLHACAKAGRDDEAQDCWRSMEAEGLVPTRVTFNILIRSFVRRQAFDEALGAMETMRKAGVQPDVVSFNTLLSGFANQGDVERACRLLLKDMPAAGVQPDRFSFSAALAVCAKEKKFAEARELVALFRALRVQADGVLFKTLISICDRCDDWALALQFFDEMKSARMPIPAEVYALLVRASARRGEDAFAQGLLEQMQAAGHRPPPTLVNLVSGRRAPAPPPGL